MNEEHLAIREPDAVMAFDQYRQWTQIDVPRSHKFSLTLLFLLAALLLFLTSLLVLRALRPFPYDALPDPGRLTFFLMACASLGLYSYLGARCKISPWYFFAINLTVLCVPLAFCGLELGRLYRYHHTYGRLNAAAFLQQMQADLSVRLEQTPLDHHDIQAYLLTAITHAPAIDRLSLTSPSHLILTCNQAQCQPFMPDDRFTALYKTAEALCQTADVHVPLMQQQHIIGQLCVNLLF